MTELAKTTPELLSERMKEACHVGIQKWSGGWEPEDTVRAWADVVAGLEGMLAASQERVREVEAENVALRANTAVSVVRRLVEQGALRGPETPA